MLGMAHVLVGDAKRMHKADTSMPVEIDSVSYVSPSGIPVYMQQSREIVGMLDNIVKKREGYRKDSVVRVAGHERAIHVTK